MERSRCKVTFVTCLFDLGTVEGNTKRRSIQEYVEKGSWLVSQDILLVIYTDVPDKVRNIISSKRIIVKHVQYTELKYHDSLKKIRRNREVNPISNINNDKDTSTYTIIGWNKFHFVNMTMKQNPFNTKHFGWIDFGISHVADTSHVVGDRIFDVVTDEIRMMMMLNFSPHILQKQKEIECGIETHGNHPIQIDNADISRFYFSSFWGITAAGFLSGHKKYWNVLCQNIDKKINFYLSLGFAPSEQQILPICYIDHPDWFDFYCGDYCSILSNVRHCRGDIKMCINNINRSLQIGDITMANSVKKYLLTSHKKGTISLSDDLIHQLQL